MDSLITAAARALAMGDPLGALNRVALRDDAPALALRGIAMAQLGDLNRAKALVRRAVRASVRERLWLARDVSLPRPRSRSLRATSPGPRRHSPRHRRPSKRMATGRTPPMRATGVWIAFLQWRTAKQKQALELNDRRFKLYETVKSC